MTAARASVVPIAPAAPGRRRAAEAASRRRATPPGPDSISSEVMSAFFPIAMANGTADVERLLMQVAQVATSMLGVSRCAVYLRNDETQLFEGQCAYGAAGIGDAISGSVCGQQFDGLTQEILETRGPVVVPDARHDSRPVRSAVLEWGVRSLVGAPIVHDDETIGLIFLDDGRHSRFYSQRDLAQLALFVNLVSGLIARAWEAARLRDEAKVLGGQNKALQLTVAFGDRLALLVAEGAGPAEVATLVAQFTGKACGIYDRHGRLRATAGPPDVPAGRYGDFEVELDAMPDIARAVARAKPGRASVLTPTGRDGRKRRLLLLRAPKESAEGGTILLEQGGGQRLHVLDAKVIRRAAAMVDLIVRTEINKSECLRALTADLLLGREQQRLPARAVQHELDLKRPRVVCVVGDAVAGQIGVGAVADAFATASGEPMRFAAEVGSHVALLLALDPELAAPEAIDRARAVVAEALRSLPGGASSRAGVSSPCYAAEDYPHALAEAQRAMESAASGDAAVAVDDLSPGNLLANGIDAGRAARFARAVIAPLLDDESAAGAALIATLVTFFDCSRNVRRTAELLEVHENTVRYRLSSVARRTGLDIVGNPRHELNVQLVLELMREGQIPCQRGGRFSANASAPSEASAE